MVPIVCGQSPEQIAQGLAFMDVILPSSSTTSSVQAKYLHHVVDLGQNDACVDMLRRAMDDCKNNPLSRKTEDGRWILDVMLDGS